MPMVKMTSATGTCRRLTKLRVKLGIYLLKWLTYVITRLGGISSNSNEA